MIPAVNLPTPGGLSYRDVPKHMRGVARTQIVGVVLARDPHGLAATTAARLVLSPLGLIGEQSTRAIGRGK